MYRLHNIVNNIFKIGQMVLVRRDGEDFKDPGLVISRDEHSDLIEVLIYKSKIQALFKSSDLRSLPLKNKIENSIRFIFS